MSLKLLKISNVIGKSIALLNLPLTYAIDSRGWTAATEMLQQVTHSELQSEVCCHSFIANLAKFVLYINKYLTELT